MEGVKEIRRRISRSSPDLGIRWLSHIDRLILSLGEANSEFLLHTYGERYPVGYATELDELVAGSGVVQAAVAEAGGRVDAPISRSVQLWTAAAPTSFAPHRQLAAPSSAMLQPADGESLGKPRAGLFTSTMIQPPDISMWRRYLDLLDGHLFPPPYKTYLLEVSPNARVAEVGSAAALVDLAGRFPRLNGGLTYINWQSLSHDYDGVHFTLPAIVATQGIVLAAGSRRVAPLFWDAETSVWLRWVFTNVKDVTSEP